MKATTIAILFVFLIGQTTSVSGQNVVAQRQLTSEKSIPKIISSTFKAQYPNALLYGWYVTHLTYWQNDYSSDWYTGWYNQRAIVVYSYQKPNYYEVEFSDNPGELSRAIYNVHGYWHETRTQIKGLPIDIHEALRTSKYNGWEISQTKEKLISPMWPVEIYRFQISKGYESLIIRMDEEGNIIQIKDLSE